MSERRSRDRARASAPQTSAPQGSAHPAATPQAATPQPGTGWSTLEEQLQAVAATEATVLLSGESGTGKSSAARRIHAASARAAGPLVEVHLGAIAPSLIESELFGHERGAFTDARKARSGAFRSAEGGTVLLDDVDLLPLDSQVKLLRALQERQVEPVGGEGPVPIDVRFCATTNRDLRAEVEAGRFREDLFYRLAVVPLELPPLRARVDEIAGLAATLVERTASRLGRTPRRLTPGAVERLERHPWPGNVRELENALERVHALEPDPRPIEAGEFEFLEEGLRGAAEELAREALARGLDAETLQRAVLEEALRLERGNVSAAARRVGLTRRAFEYRTERREDGDGS